MIPSALELKLLVNSLVYGFFNLKWEISSNLFIL